MCQPKIILNNYFTTVVQFWIPSISNETAGYTWSMEIEASSLIICSWATLLARHVMMDSLSKLEDNQYTSIEEIKRLKVQELKTILSDHGQVVTGKKADAVHSFLVSFSSVLRLFLNLFLSKSNTTFAISPLFTKKWWETGLASISCNTWAFYATLPAVVQGIRKGTILCFVFLFFYFFFL